MKIGLVGCGVAVEHQLPGIDAFAGTEIVGICDSNEGKLKELGDRLKIQNRCTELDDMLEHLKPEVVHIMTPPKTHAPLAIRAMDMGCHVLVEKPMAITSEEADQMIGTAERNKVKLCVMHNHLFDPHILRAKRMTEDGLLGDVLNVEVKYWLDKDKMSEEGLSRSEHWAHQLPLGIFGEYTPHLIYLFLCFLGNVESVLVLKKSLNDSLPDTINGIGVEVSTESGMGNILMLENMDYGRFTVHVYGTKLALHINMMDLTMTVEKERNLPKTAARMFSTVEQGFQGIVGNLANCARIITGRLRRRPGHRTLMKRFYESIQNNTEPPVTGQSGKEVVRVIELIQEQLSGGKSDGRFLQSMG